MAVKIGVANDYLDLMTVIKDFVTDETEMGVDDVWEEMTDRSSTEISGEREIWLKAPGTSNIPVYIGMQSYSDSGDDVYNIEWRVAANFSASSSFESQLDTSGRSHIYLRDNTIPYWIIANRRNIRIACRIGTVYQTGYFGYIFPYALPSQWPNAWACMGTRNDRTQRFSSESDVHRYLAFPEDSGHQFREISQGWVTIDNDSSSSDDYKLWPRYHYDTTTTSVVNNLRSDDDRVLYPLIIWRDQYAVFGELEGCYWLPGEGLASEDILEINGDDYIVIQDIFRTDTASYMAFRLN